MTWTSEPEFDGAEGREIVSDGVLIATVYSATDAPLIRAAPDLLAALEKAAEIINIGPLAREIRAAIAKAQA